ncbi:zinc transport system substrate-binding protein [Loktanella ponticola]|uniref:Zinc transport system substrate-binding protein n=1 Tax=Yoonia ponticola TaxID=1524255 RepID=A0A7W9BP33_9RHOB|nr:metal-binding protein ZinT [Yoonia ponticola]MBB5723932.1 zinc transport system substrate-binding protein [Yoonia ponticola]
MLHFTIKRAAVIAIGALVTLATQAPAQTSNSATTDSQSHAHQAHEPSLVDEADVQARGLSDWENDWQSIYPFLQDGTLDAVLAHKAEDGDKTVEEYRAYYTTGYATDVDRILIDGSSVTFFRDGQPVQGQYQNDGYEILTYESGSQGVRYIFEKSGGDEAAPQFIQFSDHITVPTKADHYHLYWGDDRAELLTEVTNWPTYFPADLSGAEIAESMIAH